MGFDPDPEHCGRCGKSARVGRRVYCEECRAVLEPAIIERHSPLRSPGGSFYYPPPPSARENLLSITKALSDEKKK